MLSTTTSDAGAGPAIEGHDGPARSTRRRRRTGLAATRVSPLHVLAGLSCGMVLGLAASPVDDVDSYWHVLVGREIIARHTIDNLGQSWLAVHPPSWRTSQWLAEVGMAELTSVWGWRGLIVVRLLVLAAILAVLARTLVPGREALVSVTVLSAVAFPLLSVAQDRPQTVSLLFVALLAQICTRLLAGRNRPPWAVIAAGCLLWAQLHPLWVLAPLAFLLTALALATDHGPRSGAVRVAMSCAAASLTGLLNPEGPVSFLLPLRFWAATRQLNEWQPTTFTHPFTAIWALLLVGTVVSWARHPRSTSRAETLWVVVWTAFGLLAFRNVVPAMLLTAPVTATALDRSWAGAAQRITRPTRTGEARLLLAGCVATVLVGGGLAAVELARLDPLQDAPARRIAAVLAARPAPVRVFNGYDTGGSLAAFGGGKVRLAIDGRADLWGAVYLQHQVEATKLADGWQQTLRAFHPDAVVLPRTLPLATALIHDDAWTVTARDGGYVLLEPNPRPGT